MDTRDPVIADEPTAQPQADGVHDYIKLMQSVTLAFKPFAVVAKLIDDADVERSRRAIDTAMGILGDSSGGASRQRRLLAFFARTKADLQTLFPKDWPTE